MSRSRPFFKRVATPSGPVVTLSITSPASRTQPTAVYTHGSFVLRGDGRSWRVLRRDPGHGFTEVGQGYRTLAEAVDAWIVPGLNPRPGAQRTGREQ